MYEENVKHKQPPCTKQGHLLSSRIERTKVYFTIGAMTCKIKFSGELY